MTYNVFGAQPCLKQGSFHCPITIFVSIKIHHFKFLISFILVNYFNNLKLISRLSVLPALDLDCEKTNLTETSQ